MEKERNLGNQQLMPVAAQKRNRREKCQSSPAVYCYASIKPPRQMQCSESGIFYASFTPFSSLNSRNYAREEAAGILDAGFTRNPS